MMNDEQYQKYIKKVITENLNSFTPQEQRTKNIISTLLANDMIIEGMANYLKNWSYNVAKNNLPHIAIKSLPLPVIKQYTIQYINWLGQNIQPIQQTRGQAR